MPDIALIITVIWDKQTGTYSVYDGEEVMLECLSASEVLDLTLGEIDEMRMLMRHGGPVHEQQS